MVAKRPIGRVEAIVIDVCDIKRGQAFWSAVTGLTFGPSYEPQFRRAALYPGSGISLVLQEVPEKKRRIKNRLHLDVEVGDAGRALKQVEALGGRLARHVHTKSGTYFIVCADPDGNEFCLVSE
ncbi:MAG: VOC family protein [Chloroflexi bacterium]|nr:VOC family protein [Chloroflexota bacterium]